MGNTPSTPKNPSTIWLGGSRPTRSAQRTRTRSKSRSKKGGQTSYSAALYGGKLKSRKRPKSRSKSRSRYGGWNFLPILS